MSSGGEVRFEVRFIASESQVEKLPDGSIVVFGAVVTHPLKYRGQVRDVISWADGSVSLGRVLRRAES